MLKYLMQKREEIAKALLGKTEVEVEETIRTMQDKLKETKELIMANEFNDLLKADVVVNRKGVGPIYEIDKGGNMTCAQ